MADREKLLSLGDPIPDQEFFTLYRGISGGKGQARRVKGLSWTSDPAPVVQYLKDRREASIAKVKDGTVAQEAEEM